MRRALSSVLTLLLLLGLSACGKTRQQAFSVTYWDYFDTAITVTGYCESQEKFDALMKRAEAELARLHALFDRYAPHEGVNGLWQLNHASGQSVPVDEPLMELLAFCKRGCAELPQVNIALGNVLELWREARRTGVLPQDAALEEAARHASMEDLVLDEQQGTARLRDAQMTLDVGAVAKGFAVERLYRFIKEEMPHVLINAGGNVRAGEAPLDGRAAWTVGILDARAAWEGESALAATVQLAQGSIVTSGGYQRFVEIDGVRCHHLIDPQTLRPGAYCLQATILCEDSARADLYSTAAFLMPPEKALAWIESLPGVEGIWMREDGSLLMTEGARARLNH